MPTTHHHQKLHTHSTAIEPFVTRIKKALAILQSTSDVVMFHVVRENALLASHRVKDISATNPKAASLAAEELTYWIDKTAKIARALPQQKDESENQRNTRMGGLPECKKELAALIIPHTTGVIVALDGLEIATSTLEHKRTNAHFTQAVNAAATAANAIAKVSNMLGKDCLAAKTQEFHALVKHVKCRAPVAKGTTTRAIQQQGIKHLDECAQQIEGLTPSSPARGARK